MRNMLSKYRIPLMLILSGALTSLPLVCPSFGFVQWVSIIPAALVLKHTTENKETKLKRIYGYGLLFFMSYYLVIYHWFLYMYPLDFAGISRGASAVVVCVAWFGLSFIQTVGSALVFVVFALIVRTKTLANAKPSLPLFAGAVWCVFEWSQTIGWWGVPWGRLCLGQSGATFLLLSSSLLGSYVVTFVIVAVNFFLAYAISCKEKKRLMTILAVAVFSVNLIMCSFVRLTYRESDDKIAVAAVQGNIPSSEKWEIETLDKTLDIHKKYTTEAAKKGADIVVWSETAIPYDFFKNTTIMSFVSEVAKEAGVTILVSAFTEYEARDDARQNSLIEIRPDGTYGEAIYSKQRLVPFGEFVPMRELVMFLIPPLAQIGMLEEDLIAGEESTVIETDSGVVGCCICFDSIYETVTREAVLNGAQMIAVSTNDSWFSDSAALYMHNSQSALRAIETGRYVVRSANTGISSIIDPMGKVKQSLGADVEGYVVDEISLRDTNTLYTAIGNAFVYLCVFSIIAVFVCSRIQKNAYKNRIVKNY